MKKENPSLEKIVDFSLNTLTVGVAALSTYAAREATEYTLQNYSIGTAYLTAWTSGVAACCNTALFHKGLQKVREKSGQYVEKVRTRILESPYRDNGL